MINLPFKKIFHQIFIFLTSVIIFIGDVVIKTLVETGRIIIGAFALIATIFTHAIRRIIAFIKWPFESLKRNTSARFKKKVVRVKKAIAFILFRLKFIVIGVLIASFVFLIFLSYSFLKSLPNPSLIGKVNYPVSTKIFDRNGTLLYEFHREQDRTPVSIENVPEIVIQATVAVEDKDFFSHNGISVVNGMLRALKETAKTGHIQGGSTITQQLIKTALLSPERTIDRKVREIILALWAEQLYTKREILEMYLNQVPYGGSSYGIESASKTYFGISSSDLSIAQAAFLAGLPQAPSYYSPYVDKTKAFARRNQVLRAMRQQGYITSAQYDTESKVPIVVRDPDTYIKAPHFVFYVKSYLDKMFGLRYSEEGGLRVTTSLDLNLQNDVESIVATELESLASLNVSNGAVLVTRPNSGEILSMVGSKNYFEDPYGSYNVTTALRQPGSSIKPIMYALALEKGYTAASVIDDSPITYSSNGGPSYTPVNYDGSYHGRVPLRYALANSYNIPAVKVLNTLGVDNFINHATKMGLETFTDPSRYGLSITLGGAEVKLVDMATAYGVFANYGRRVDLNPILSVKDFAGNDLYDSASEQSDKNVISDAVAFIISSILSDNKARESSFGPNSQLVIPGHTVAVKTGTTNSKRDNLTVGYTRSFLTSVWVGNNDNTPMDQNLVSGITGAAPIWNKVMTRVLNTDWNFENEGESGFYVPDSVVEKQCFFNTPEYFVKGTEESISCQSKEIKAL